MSAENIIENNIEINSMIEKMSVDNIRENNIAINSMIKKLIES